MPAMRLCLGPPDGGECREFVTPPATRCPPCQTAVNRLYAPVESAARRGYGRVHRNAREAALAAFVPGTPCPRCGLPMLAGQELDLGHVGKTRADRPGSRLEHRRCNRSHREPDTGAEIPPDDSGLFMY